MEEKTSRYRAMLKHQIIKGFNVLVNVQAKKRIFVVVHFKQFRSYSCLKIKKKNSHV